MWLCAYPDGWNALIKIGGKARSSGRGGLLQEKLAGNAGELPLRGRTCHSGNERTLPPGKVRKVLNNSPQTAMGKLWLMHGDRRGIFSDESTKFARGNHELMRFLFANSLISPWTLSGCGRLGKQRVAPGCFSGRTIEK